MPRLSLYTQNRGNDYTFMDKIIREQYTVGGIDLYIHLFESIKTDNGDLPLNPPADEVTTPLPIEDLLFLENRNRNYSDNVHIMRGIYKVQDLDFDLSQFGLFIAGDTLYISFHYNDMIDNIGRKFVNGDVIEIPNLKDYNPLNQLTPSALPKYYVVQEGSFASEGFSQTWAPHLWRVKCVPMKGSQEFKDILDTCMDTSGGIDGDNGECNDTCTLNEWLCQHNNNLYINDGVIEEANKEVPLSGYDNDKFFILGDGQDMTINVYRADTSYLTADDGLNRADNGIARIKSDGFAVGYLTGNGMPPNGQPLTTAMTFPLDAREGEYVLRIDYQPNRLFQFDGTMWITIEDNVRTDMYLGDTVLTQRNSFVNNDEVIQTSDRGNIPSRQSLSKILKPEDDN